MLMTAVLFRREHDVHNMHNSRVFTEDHLKVKRNYGTPDATYKVRK